MSVLGNDLSFEYQACPGEIVNLADAYIELKLCINTSPICQYDPAAVLPDGIVIQEKISLALFKHATLEIVTYDQRYHEVATRKHWDSQPCPSGLCADYRCFEPTGCNPQATAERMRVFYNTAHTAAAVTKRVALVDLFPREVLSKHITNTIRATLRIAMRPASEVLLWGVDRTRAPTGVYKLHCFDSHMVFPVKRLCSEAMDVRIKDYEAQRAARATPLPTID
jgi:hypothetical protein